MTYWVYFSYLGINKCLDHCIVCNLLITIIQNHGEFHSVNTNWFFKYMCINIMQCFTISMLTRINIISSYLFLFKLKLSQSYLKERHFPVYWALILPSNDWSVNRIFSSFHLMIYRFCWIIILFLLGKDAFLQ